MLRYRLKKFAPLLIGIVTFLLMLGGIAAIAFSSASSSVIPLGNAAAPRATTTQPMVPQRANGSTPDGGTNTTQPSSSDAAPATSAETGDPATNSAGASGDASSIGANPPNSSSSATFPSGTPVRSYSADEQQTRQQAILAAYNCARQARQLSPLALDPTLSRKAEASWLALHNSTRGLESLGQAYPLFNLVAFDDSLPAQGCAFGGFDASMIPTLYQTQTIGIAAFPAQDDEGQDSPSALIIGK